jgi:putative membrane protein
LGLLAGGVGRAAAMNPLVNPATQPSPSPINPSQSAHAPSGMDDMQVSDADRTFVEKAGKGGLAEVKLGELAATQGGDDKVKDFAKHMIEQHSHVNQKLIDVAQSQGVQAPV